MQLLNLTAEALLLPVIERRMLDPGAAGLPGAGAEAPPSSIVFA